MRWDSLRLIEDAEPPEGTTRALFAQGAVTRTFDTPQFRGITFHEIRAKSIINRVPGASRVPFSWTINPYRGCSHACSYCCVGETPILMADGRTRQLKDVRVGDRIIGTVADGRSRRFTETEVLAHWRTEKPAHRVTLGDGTVLVASGDHRFLTDRGWKHVTGAAQGAARRPHLTTNNSLAGLGAFALPPKETPEYRRGYLHAVLRADPAAPASGAPAVRGRIADYLADHPDAAAQGPESWPAAPGAEWRKGFLAGMADAAGVPGSPPSLAHGDDDLIDTALTALDTLGFDTELETTGRRRAERVSVLRVLGGPAERLRFVHTVGPASAPDAGVVGHPVRAGARLRVASVEPLGLVLPMYDITTGTGDFIANGVVSHNCFARKTHEYLDFDAGRDFDSQIVVKVNAPELVRRELAAPRWRGDHIAMGTNVDCYQRAEGRYRLMPGIIAALRDAANPFSILTKGSLILRDLDLLAEAAEVTDVAANVSAGFLDRDLWRTLESGTPAPEKRLEVCAALNDRGIACGVLMAPIVPYLTDSPKAIDTAVAAIAQTGATHVTPIVLHLRPGAREWFLAWLQAHHPTLVPRYHDLYSQGAYAPKRYQQTITDRVQAAATRHAIGHPTRAQPRRITPRPPPPKPPTPQAEQLTLL
ncbi:MAG TPA: intein-containing Rv2578c family radical SAM protein [Streptosporangiaceae bacterium]|jgi:DNA repair photolyase